MNGEFFTTYGAFLSTVAQRIQSCSFGAVRTKQMTRRVALGQAHFFFDMRHK